ncbi:hypothetical protein ABOM_000353 [Aspergillus bombycis]|uniref:ATPase AAA-type core domain-containing protein n=1 Tax=Aspergillus bombycis TaxID=109264 RepID=A0A1F8AH54_9EURO|nr:hypothetical protein ABOM_000353 [Aspergillus bombycis]OGM51041.1 hypothetical protein ABOM_000353 [Aspergillus bombycis]
MAPTVFIAGKHYCDRLRYLHSDGSRVTTADIPGGGALVSDLLSQLKRNSAEPKFVNRNDGTAVQTTLEVQELQTDPPRHRIKSLLRLECQASRSGEESTIKISKDDLLVFVDQHDVGSFEVDPWYRIFQRTGQEIEPSSSQWKKLYEYATTAWQDKILDPGWEALGVVIDAEYLRWKHVEISRHLSWGQTTEDLFRNFIFKKQVKPELEALRKTPNLVVRFDCDGVVHVESSTTQDAKAKLYIQKSENSEGDFIQSTPGRTPAVAAGFMAGLVRSLAQNSQAYERAIQSGLLVSQKAALAEINLKDESQNGLGSSNFHYYKLHGMESLDFPTLPAPDDNASESTSEDSLSEGTTDSETMGRDTPASGSTAPETASGDSAASHSQGLAIQVPVPSSQIKNHRGYRWSILQTILEGERVQSPGQLGAQILDLAQGITNLRADEDSHNASITQPSILDFPERTRQKIRKFLQNRAATHASDLNRALTAYVNLQTSTELARLETNITSFLEEYVKSHEQDDIAGVQAGIECLLSLQFTGILEESRSNIQPFASKIIQGRLTPDHNDIQAKITTLAQQLVTKNRTDDEKLHWKTKELADKIVKEGCKTALAGVPTARFGSLMTADREEKESFRAIANLVIEYLRSPKEKPISIGVFGAPGSGKSFGIKEVVKAVAERVSNGGKKVSKPLTFNLSQFREYNDLVVAFHTVRDSGLSNEVPLVLFDEFDSGFGETKLGWLQYLLAPMQDGKFLEHGHERPLGPAIFVFIGGTCSTFEDFTTDLATKDAKDAKKPDFVSRLRGFVNIQGSHYRPTDTDYMYLIRRAIHLRAMLQNRLGCKANDKIELDDGVLNALLTVAQFRHGARSLESIIAMSQLHGQKVFRRSALPSAKQLGLHVDHKAFVKAFEPENHDAIARVRIAEKILPAAVQSHGQDDFRQRIASQILDMVDNNGARLVPTQPSTDVTHDEELVNHLAKYRYNAFNLNITDDEWQSYEDSDEKEKYQTSIRDILKLLNKCGFAVQNGS